MSPLQPATLRRESVTVAVILGFWTAVALLAEPFAALRTALRTAGVVVALGYVTVRGVTLARSVPVSALPSGTEQVLRENLAVLRGVGLWFLAALVVEPVADIVLFQLVPLPRPLRDPTATLVEGLVFVLAATGVVTVALHAITAAVARIEALDPAAGRAATDDTPGD